MKRVLSLLMCSTVLGGSLLSCGDTLVDPKLPFGATPFTPPSFYADWWEMTKACTGRSGSLSDVTWYTVPEGVPLELDGEQVSAYWSAASNQIVVSASVRDNGQVVRHEMLHALLGSKGHPRQEFLEKCLGYVACSTKCVADAGPAPIVPASVPRVTPAALEVTMAITPFTVRSSVNHGHFTLTVRARNPAGSPVFVVLPTPSGAGKPVSFSYQFFGPSGESDFVYMLDEGVASFAAGETKIHVFDFFADNEGALMRHLFPGQYTVAAGYGLQMTPSQALQLF